MAVPPPLADLSRLYQTEFVRSARAVGVLWAVCTLCFAIIQVVVLVQPSWIGTADVRPQAAGSAQHVSGSLGLFEVSLDTGATMSYLPSPLISCNASLCAQVCVDPDWLVPDCRGGLSSLSPLPSFQSVAVLVGVSLWAVWTSVLCLCLFRFCSAATVYKICGWLQLTAGQNHRLHWFCPSCCAVQTEGNLLDPRVSVPAGFCLALACLLFPDSWESPEMRALCGDSVSLACCVFAPEPGSDTSRSQCDCICFRLQVGSFSPGNCSVHWAYILAILGILDAAILATLAFVLANRQDALLPPDAKEGEADGS